MRIDLVRHGQTAWGKAAYRDLTETGQAQARALGAWWARSGLTPSDVVVGPLDRHVQTEALSRQAAARAGLSLPPARPEPRLEEAHAKEVLGAALARWAEGGPLQEDARGVLAHTASKDVVFRLFRESVRRWIVREDIVPDIEDWPDFRARAAGILDGLAAEATGEHVVAHTSGGLIGGVVGALLGADDEPMADLVFCTWSTHFASFRQQDGRWVLYRFNSGPHLEDRLRTHW
jgi:broad specificity phosphatase PhoE